MAAMAIQSRPIRSSDDELVAQMRQFEDDSNYLAVHYQVLLDRFPEQWVAVFKGQVVAHGTNINAVSKELANKRVPSNRVAVAFLSRRRKTLIL